MITFDAVSLAYGGRGAERSAIDRISFEIPDGAFTFLTGRSGAGKSSLLRLIAGLETPSSGEIHVDGVRYASLKPRRVTALRRRMGLIFQDNQLLLDRDVFDNVALPLIINRFSWTDIRRRVPTALERVGLGGLGGANPATLSGGEQQRVGIARALVARPRLLLADEPTGNLDADMSREIMDLLLDFNHAGVTVLLATHDTGLLEAHDLPRLTLSHGRLAGREPARAAEPPHASPSPPRAGRSRS